MHFIHPLTTSISWVLKMHWKYMGNKTQWNCYSKYKFLLVSLATFYYTIYLLTTRTVSFSMLQLDPWLYQNDPWTSNGLLSIHFNYLTCSLSRPEHPPDVVNICLEYLRTNYQVSSNQVIELGKLSKEKCWSIF